MLILASESLYSQYKSFGRCPPRCFSRAGRRRPLAPSDGRLMEADLARGSIGLWGVPLAVLAGAVRIGTPFLFVSLGECLTAKEWPREPRSRGTLVMGP